MHPLCINEANGGHIGVTGECDCGVADMLKEVLIIF